MGNKEEEEDDDDVNHNDSEVMADANHVDVVRRVAAAALQKLNDDLFITQSASTTTTSTSTTSTSTTSNCNDDNNDTDTDPNGPYHNYYWLGQQYRCRPLPRDASYASRFFQCWGFVRLPQFASMDECLAMKAEMTQWVHDRWHPGEEAKNDDDDEEVGRANKKNVSRSSSSSSKIETFSTDDTTDTNHHASTTRRSHYFMESSNQVHFFAEPQALMIQQTKHHSSNQNETTTSAVLHRTFKNNKHKIDALNKAGHGLHLEKGSTFYAFTRSGKVQQLLLDLGWIDPVVPQSMYICKPPAVGGVVTSHQDSTFLYTTPYPSCIGVWLALDDATLDNGCLWVRPQSHHEPVRRQYCRNPHVFGTSLCGDNDDHHNHNHNHNNSQPPAAAAVGENGSALTTQPPLFWMKNLRTAETTDTPLNDVVGVGWDGSLPNGGTRHGLLQAGFVPLECSAGDVLAFCGTLDHLSLANASPYPRHTFQLHLVEGPSQGVVWSSHNWLQYPTHQSFMRLLDNT